jgi:hypothetical protein
MFSPVYPPWQYGHRGGGQRQRREELRRVIELETVCAMACSVIGESLGPSRARRLFKIDQFARHADLPK